MISAALPRLPAGHVRARALAKARTASGASGGPQTALGDLAATIQTSGQTATLTSSGSNGLTSTLISGAPDHVTNYCDKGNWFPSSQKAIFIGQGHNGAQKTIQYDAQSDLWSQLAVPAWDTSFGNGGSDIGHGYHHNAANRSNGDYYYRRYNSGTVYRWDGSAWQTLSAFTVDFMSVAGGIEWFPELDGGSGGLVYAGRSTVAVRKGSTWTVLDNGTRTFGEAENICLYSPQYAKVFFGGGGTNRNFYSIDASEARASLASFPIDVSSQASTVNVVDPNNGDILCMNGSTGRRYNPSTDSWSTFTTPLTGTSGVTAFPITNHGVVMFLRWNGGTPDAILWKP